MTDASMSMDEIGKTRKPLAEFWKRFLRQKVALVALAFLILLIGAMATILVSFYLFAYHDNWLFLLGIGVYGAALLVPTGIMASKTRSRAVGGHETALDLPASAATNISKPAGH